MRNLQNASVIVILIESIYKNYKTQVALEKLRCTTMNGFAIDSFFKLQKFWI